MIDFSNLPKVNLPTKTTFLNFLSTLPFFLTSLYVLSPNLINHIKPFFMGDIHFYAMMMVCVCLSIGWVTWCLVLGLLIDSFAKSWPSGFAFTFAFYLSILLLSMNLYFGYSFGYSFSVFVFNSFISLTTPAIGCFIVVIIVVISRKSSNPQSVEHKKHRLKKAEE